MKKRAQIPDARTFTTLFRGFAWHAKTNPTALEKALSIYHSMFIEDAPVRPSIIHTNAVLKVCAFAGDMDALLGVAAKLPDRGNGAPDTLSYTTILHAVRNSALVDRVKYVGSRSGAEKGAIAVGQGRKLWEEIRTRWAKGDLFVDEELVCAAGRVLLLGGERDADDVLSLLEQTMGIPRQVPVLGDPARHGVRPQQLDRKEDEENGSLLLQTLVQHPSSATTSRPPPHLPPLDAHTAAASPFAPLPNQNDAAFITPGRNTLSLALEACTSMSLPRPAQDYWGLLTSPTSEKGYDITPDTQNYQAYLRLLRLQRASKLAVELVQDIKEGRLTTVSQPQDGGRAGNPTATPTTTTIKLEPKIFKLAMSACKRDKNNRHALRHATALVRIMLNTLEDADPATLTSYLKLAVRGYSRTDVQALLAVEKVAGEGWRNLKSLVVYGSHDDDKEHNAQDDEKHEEDDDPSEEEKEARTRPNFQVTEFAQTFIALYDRILAAGREKLNSPTMNRLREEKARLMAWLRRRQAGREMGLNKGWKRLGKVEDEDDDVDEEPAVGTTGFRLKKFLVKPLDEKEDVDVNDEGEVAMGMHEEGKKMNNEEDTEAGGVAGARRTTPQAPYDPAQRTLRQHSKSFSFKPRPRESELASEEVATSTSHTAGADDDGDDFADHDDGYHHHNHHHEDRYRSNSKKDVRFAPDPQRRSVGQYTPLVARTPAAVREEGDGYHAPSPAPFGRMDRRMEMGGRRSETGLRSEQQWDKG